MLLVSKVCPGVTLGMGSGPISWEQAFACCFRHATLLMHVDLTNLLPETCRIFFPHQECWAGMTGMTVPLPYNEVG